MESELLKVRVAAIHMYRFEGEEIDKRSEKARRDCSGHLLLSLAAQEENPEKVLIPLLECSSPWVAVESDNLLKLLPLQEGMIISSVV